MFKEIIILGKEKERYLKKIFALYKIELEKVAREIALDLEIDFDYIKIRDIDACEWGANLSFRFDIEYYKNLTVEEVKNWIEEFGVHPAEDEDFQEEPFCNIRLLSFDDDAWVSEVYHNSGEIQNKIEAYFEKIL